MNLWLVPPWIFDLRHCESLTFTDMNLWLATTWMFDFHSPVGREFLTCTVANLWPLLTWIFDWTSVHLRPALSPRHVQLTPSTKMLTVNFWSFPLWIFDLHKYLMCNTVNFWPIQILDLSKYESSTVPLCIFDCTIVNIWLHHFESLTEVPWIFDLHSLFWTCSLY